jgi:lipoprotein signal peptidase
MNLRRVVLFGLWCTAFIVALHFLRFQFGIFNISAFAIVIGVCLMVWFGNPGRRRSS